VLHKGVAYLQATLWIHLSGSRPALLSPNATLFWEPYLASYREQRCPQALRGWKVP
jgi:hypothetical protein